MSRSAGELAGIRHVPNALSVLRLGFAVAFPFVPESWWIALVLAAGFSDWLDGWIARRFQATSWIGGLLDGVSDKAFVLSALFTRAGWAGGRSRCSSCATSRWAAASR